MKIPMKNLYPTNIKKQSTKLELERNLWSRKIINKYERKYKVNESQ